MKTFDDYILEKHNFLKTDDDDIQGYIKTNCEQNVMETIQEYMTTKNTSGEETYSSFSPETERKIKIWCRMISLAFDVNCLLVVSEDSVYAYKKDLSKYKARKEGMKAGKVALLKKDNIKNEDTLKQFVSTLNAIKGDDAKFEDELTMETKIKNLK